MRHFSAILLAILIFSPFSAQAASLQETVAMLEILPVSYGVNEVQLNGVATIIVRGRFQNGNAWDGDIYTVLQKGEGNWRMVRHEASPRSSVLTETLPHAEEDSIDSVRFMVPKGEATSGRLTSLYLLRAVRDYEPDKDGTRTNFMLFIVQTDKDFDILRFHELSKARSEAAYCNVDWAMDRELGVPVRSGENEFPCGKSGASQ